MIIWHIGDGLHALSRFLGIRRRRPESPAKSDSGNECSELDFESKIHLIRSISYLWNNVKNIFGTSSRDTASFF